jgi:glycerate 2-kinase
MTNATDRMLAEHARAIWNAGVESVRADQLIAQTVSIDDFYLTVGEVSIERSTFDRVLIVGAGKAVAAMTRALDRVLSPHMPTYGWVNVPEGTSDSGECLSGNVRLFPARPQGCNEPTPKVIEGTTQILKLVSAAGPRDLCLVVLSGGGSALLAAPVDGISLDNKLAVTRHLSGGGATINQLNTVRKHLSRVKGGRLAKASCAGQLVTLVLSDVLGDPLDVIASGPTVIDRSTPAQALSVLEYFDPLRTLPNEIYSVLENAPPNTDVVDFPVVVLGNNATAVDAAGIHAESLGYSHAMTVATSSEGSAESVGIHHAQMALAMIQDRDAGKKTPDCIITGGEPTVRLAAPEVRGRGGRNMQVVLAAINRFMELNVGDHKIERIAFLSGGTDGEDGPTDAAGAIFTADVWRNIASLGLMPSDYLARSDAYTFFEKCNGLLITGPTHTNVCDVRVLVIK